MVVNDTVYWETCLMQNVGRVVALSRFPVKSTAGESLSSAVLDERGFAHDREWAMYLSDGGIVSGKTDASVSQGRRRHVVAVKPPY